MRWDPELWKMRRNLQLSSEFQKLMVLMRNWQPIPEVDLVYVAGGLIHIIIPM